MGNCQLGLAIFFINHSIEIVLYCLPVKGTDKIRELVCHPARRKTQTIFAGAGQALPAWQTNRKDGMGLAGEQYKGLNLSHKFQKSDKYSILADMTEYGENIILSGFL